MRRALLVLMVATLAAVPVWAHEEDAGEVEPVPALTVQGTGRVQAAPDEATVRLGVVAQRATAREAQGEANRIANAVLAAIGGLGVPREQIQTSELQLFPVYAPDAPPERVGTPAEPRIVGYRASNVVSVRLERLDLIGPVVDAGLGAGANQVEGVFFGLRSDLAPRQQALRQAATEARRKAEALAEALGIRLGGLLEVAEGGVSIVAPRFRSRAALEVAQDMAVSTPVSPGQIAVEATVTLTYRLDVPPRP